MLEDYYVKPSTIDRVRSSWLAPQIETYLEWLQAHGYSRRVVYRRLPLLFQFADFAQKKGCRDIASCKAYIKEFVSQWLEQHGVKAKTAVAVRKHPIDAECGVRQKPVTRNRRRGPFPLESAVPGFAEYLRTERGFAEGTIRNYRRHLSEFAQYLSQTGVTSFSPLSPPVLAAFVVEHTPKMIDDFLKSRPRVSPRSYNHLLGVVHRFFAFAVMQQWTQRNPVTASPRPETGGRIPYLFDLKAARQLLAVGRSLPENSMARYRGLVYETIFALIYGLGLRVGEVLRLTLADADFSRDLLFIRATKFCKNRIVPLGPNLALRLKRYVEQRHGSNAAPERPLFSFTKRGCIHEGTISQTFHTLLPKLQLHIPPGVSPPRLHDLRHSFAVATLLRWYRQGIDPNCRLMHLATFLGHVDPNSTAVYLTITEELLHQAAQRFQVLAPKGGVR